MKRLLCCGLLLGAASPALAAEIESFENGLKPWRIRPAGVARLETETVHEGGKALRFSLEERGKARLPLEENDWSKYEAISFWAYSPRASEAVLGLGLDSENPASDGWVYFYLPFPVNWSGWKHFVIPKSRFKASRNPSWEQIKSLFFSTADWPFYRLEAGMYVIFDDIRLLTAEEVDALKP
mgnify:CR=1 FL=1